MSHRQVVAQRCARCYTKADKACARCKLRWYCSAACQKKDWELGHKYSCNKPQLPPVAARPPLPPRLLYTAATAAELMAAPLSARYAGLRNIGNTCYINAALQCAMATTPLIAGLRMLPDGAAPLGKLLVECADALTAKSKAALTGTAETEPHAPATLVNRLIELSNSMVFGRQEDSHELLQVLLVSLAQEMSQGAMPRESETTLVHQLFRSIVASQLLCPDCGFISVSFEAYLDLQLEISAYTDTLQDMLEAFTCPERLDANNLYRCAGCQNQVRAHKQLSLFQAPNILTIQLKRFRPGVFGKLNQYIQFPKLLNLTTVLTPGSDEGVLEYELYAVLLHLDMYNLTFFGHYICATKAADGTWWLCDDDKVEKISVDDVLKLNAYMLFYRRKTPRNMATAPDPSSAPVSRTQSASNGAKTPVPAPAEEPAEAAPTPCANGCGFFGRPEQDGFCSKCFKERFPERAEALAATARAEAEAAKAAAASAAANRPASTGPSSSSIASTASSNNSSAAKPAAKPATVASAPKVAPAMRHVGRNDPCPCGSGRKYKKCHGTNA